MRPGVTHGYVNGVVQPVIEYQGSGLSSAKPLGVSFSPGDIEYELVYKTRTKEYVRGSP